MISAVQIKRLREETGISIMECKKAMEESGGNFEKAHKILIQKGATVALKKSSRVTHQGIIDAYVHSNKIGALIELNCETDFVARNPIFRDLAHDLSMQIASMNPKNIDELMRQEFIKDPSIAVSDLINQKIQKIGENITIAKFIRYELGE